jgi:putative transcriptional regulator
MSRKHHRKLHNRVRKLREQHKLTQSQLGDALAVPVSRQAIADVEKGTFRPSIDLALDLAAHFGLPLEQVFSHHAFEEDSHGQDRAAAPADTRQ